MAGHNDDQLLFDLGPAGRRRRIALAGHMVARAAMAPTPAMQREAIRRAIVAVLAVLIVRPIGALHLLRRRLRLAAGDEGRQSFDVFVVRLEVLLPGLEVLRLRLLRLRVLMRLLVLRLLVLRRLLFARIKRRLLWRVWLTADRRLIAVAVAVVEGVVGIIAAALLRLLLVEGRLGLTEMFLRRRDQAEIVLSVLIVVFGSNGIARTLRVAGK